jgi:predicted alpha-1,2-mannosidase
MDGKNIRAYFNFDTNAGEQIKIKIALSNTGMDGALKNLEAEVPHWNFNQVKQETQEKWNAELNKVQVETLTKADKISFYTSLYHTMLTPILYEDVDGKYLGLDQNIHQSDGFTNYTIFSLWDTYRALHPWLTIYQPKRNNDMIKSMLAHQEQSVHGMLPIWSHYANENWCMIGYHSVPVIADAIAKDIADFDEEKALQACIATSTVPYFDGLKDYMEIGYVPDEKGKGLNNSVSKTLEFAYDDWTIAQIANKLGNKDVEATYLKRSESYKNVYDASINFMKPKNRKGEWRKQFDPLDTHGQGFIEGNAWTYSLFVPHNPQSLIELMGGDEVFIQHLDSLFTMDLPDKYIEHNEDITRDGIMGNYVHGNEPGHHIPYLYNWTSKPWKTQERVRIILRDMYGVTPDGLCGNDDAGQMSAWYIFSSLGFYPVSPGNDQYAIGSPLIKNATLHLENGKILTITTENQGQDNFFVQKVEINGKAINRNYLKHSDITNGGGIKFYLGNKPNKSFGI